MVKRCFVPNCKTGRKSDRHNEHKFSLFKAPNDESQLVKWREHLPPRDRELTSKDCVCAKHFEKRYVIPRFQQSRFGDYYEDNIRTKLAQGAVPTIFNDAESSGRNFKPYITFKNQSIVLPNIFKFDLPDVEVNENDTVPICYQCLLGKCDTHAIFH